LTPEYLDAAEALATIDGVQIEQMAEEVLADAQLIGVLMTAEEEAAQVLKAKHSRGHNQAER